jgi:hypothetical protein
MLAALVRPVVSSLVMGAAVAAWLAVAHGAPLILRLVSAIGIGVVVYALVVRVVARDDLRALRGALRRRSGAEPAGAGAA